MVANEDAQEYRVANNFHFQHHAQTHQWKYPAKKHIKVPLSRTVL
jgi:hypothetical protein